MKLHSNLILLNGLKYIFLKCLANASMLTIHVLVEMQYTRFLSKVDTNTLEQNRVTNSRKWMAERRVERKKEPQRKQIANLVPRTRACARARPITGSNACMYKTFIGKHDELLSYVANQVNSFCLHGSNTETLYIYGLFFVGLSACLQPLRRII